jgi:hypothetical protein
MLKIFKNKKAQNTAEYAILIALVVGGVIAMQTYAQRTLQGRLRDASVAFRDQTANIDGNNSAKTLQYEPYYTNSSSQVDKDSEKTQTTSNQTDTTMTTKKSEGYVDQTTYNNGAVKTTGDATEAGF